VSYPEYFGLWLNRKRAGYRAAGAVAYGAGAGTGFLTPGMEYYRALTDGEGEALAMKARDELARKK
jgi:hypothetical protein